MSCWAKWRDIWAIFVHGIGKSQKCYVTPVLAQSPTKNMEAEKTHTHNGKCKIIKRSKNTYLLVWKWMRRNVATERWALTNWRPWSWPALGLESSHWCFSDYWIYKKQLRRRSSFADIATTTIEHHTHSHEQRMRIYSRYKCIFIFNPMAGKLFMNH